MAKYRQCTSRVTALVRNQVAAILQQATQQALAKKVCTYDIVYINCGVVLLVYAYLRCCVTYNCCVFLYRKCHQLSCLRKMTHLHYFTASSDPVRLR